MSSTRVTMNMRIPKTHCGVINRWATKVFKVQLLRQFCNPKNISWRIKYTSDTFNFTKG